jgi:DNA-binding transcriptional LysR family regulator
MHFDLTDLRLFLHTIDAGSITAGAQRANLALASASARVRGLEDTLGTPLLLRGRRGVQPTAAGEALAYHARTLLQHVDRMQEDLGDYASGFKGRVRLLCNTAAMTEYLPEPLALFLRDHPNIDVDLQEEPSHRILPELRAGTADVGIVSDALDLSGLHTLPFRCDRLVVLAPRGHTLARRKRVRFADTLAHDHVGMAVSAALGVYLDDQAARLGRRLHFRARLHGFDAVARMVAQGAGLGVMPQSAASRWQARNGMRMLILDDDWADRQLMLCVRSMEGLPHYAQALVHALTQKAGESA